ncbi:helix-turn-helix transcriptional regulator [Fulvivirgaceae bacterium BMA12]|uniref:Helix-turn-helix transcriptional regulator n=1 Tax=Agaribacillus aureus TaxID=3051825 RepID=A0ABT8LDN7_9BACT|nr:helix-turn-helix transcriptional regulator [Fulvivirgaceae bacterium BMA12]
MNSTELIKGTLTTIILKLLADNGKMYGYEITQRVKELSDNKILIKEGSLYPALHKLLKDGLVQVETVNIGKRIRKYYSITKQGELKKQVQSDELKEFLQTIHGMIFPQQDLLSNDVG